jgi:AbrB family looped-hinge helix DNA binding protein
MRVTAKGQVTIPIAMREKAGIFPDTEVEFGFSGNKITIEKAKPKKGRMSRGEEAIRRLRGKSTANLDMTTDEILALMRNR